MTDELGQVAEALERFEERMDKVLGRIERLSGTYKEGVITGEEAVARELHFGKNPPVCYQLGKPEKVVYRTNFLNL